MDELCMIFGASVIGPCAAFSTFHLFIFSFQLCPPFFMGSCISYAKALQPPVPLAMVHFTYPGFPHRLKIVESPMLPVPSRSVF